MWVPAWVLGLHDRLGTLEQHVLRFAAVAVVVLAALVTGSASLAGTGSSLNIDPTAYYADGPIDVTVTYQWVPEGLFNPVTLSSTSAMPVTY